MNAIYTLVHALSAQWWQDYGWGMGPGMRGGWGLGMGWFSSILMLVLWILVIVGIVYLIRWVAVSTKQGERGRTEDSALEILRRRYAKGEIDKEEFDQKRKDLGG